MPRPAPLSPALVQQAAPPEWRVIVGLLRTRYRTGGFTTGLRLIEAITPLAEEANHHPDVVLKYGSVDIALTTHDVGALTQLDLDLAQQISDVALGMGLTAEPAGLAGLTVALNTADQDAIRPFWTAVLGLVDDPHDETELIDPRGDLPRLWFQQAPPAAAAPLRFHLDLHLPADQVAARLDAALAAGGRLVTESFAPRWWVLADADGNQVCLCAPAEAPGE